MKGHSIFMTPFGINFKFQPPKEGIWPKHKILRTLSNGCLYQLNIFRRQMSSSYPFGRGGGYAQRGQCHLFYRFFLLRASLSLKGHWCCHNRFLGAVTPPPPPSPGNQGHKDCHRKIASFEGIYHQISFVWTLKLILKNVGRIQGSIFCVKDTCCCLGIRETSPGCIRCVLLVKENKSSSHKRPIQKYL